MPPPPPPPPPKQTPRAPLPPAKKTSTAPPPPPPRGNVLSRKTPQKTNPVSFKPRTGVSSKFSEMMKGLEVALAGKDKNSDKEVGMKDLLRNWKAADSSSRKSETDRMVEDIRKSLESVSNRRAYISNRVTLLRANPMTVKNSQKEAFAKLYEEKSEEAKRLSKSIRQVFDEERESLAREDALLVSASQTMESISNVAKAFGSSIALPSNFPNRLSPVVDLSNNVRRGALRPGVVSGLRDYADYLSFYADEVLSKRLATKKYDRVSNDRANSGEIRALKNAVAKLEKNKAVLTSRLEKRADWMKVARRDRRRLLSRIGAEREKASVKNYDLTKAFAGLAVRSPSTSFGKGGKKRGASYSNDRSGRSGPMPMNWSPTNPKRARV